MFLKWVKGFLTLYDKTYIKVLFIFKTPEATFKEVRINPSAKICLTAINALRQLRQDRIQRVSTENETKIKIGETLGETR